MRVSHRTGLLAFTVAILAACGSKETVPQASAEPTAKSSTAAASSSARSESSAPAKKSDPQPTSAAPSASAVASVAASASANPLAVAPPSFGFKYKSPRNDFEVVFPKAPEPEKEVEQELQGIKMKIVALGSSVEDHGVFVSRTDFSIAPSQYDIEKGLKGMLDGGFGQSGCTLEKTTSIKNGAYKGIEGTGQAPQGMGLCSMRAFVVPKKTIIGYGMVVVGKISNEKAAQYFEAFKILE